MKVSAHAPPYSVVLSACCLKLKELQRVFMTVSAGEKVEFMERRSVLTFPYMVYVLGRKCYTKACIPGKVPRQA